MVESTHVCCVAIILICVKESHLNDAHAAAANKYAFQAVHSPCMYIFVHMSQKYVCENIRIDEAISKITQVALAK